MLDISNTFIPRIVLSRRKIKVVTPEISAAHPPILPEDVHFVLNEQAGELSLTLPGNYAYPGIDNPLVELFRSVQSCYRVAISILGSVTNTEQILIPLIPLPPVYSEERDETVCTFVPDNQLGLKPDELNACLNTAAAHLETPLLEAFQLFLMDDNGWALLEYCYERYTSVCTQMQKLRQEQQPACLQDEFQRAVPEQELKRQKDLMDLDLKRKNAITDAKRTIANFLEQIDLPVITSRVFTTADKLAAKRSGDYRKLSQALATKVVIRERA